MGDQPRNPVVELRVYLPGGKEPVRQVAKASFANPGGMHIEKCPVKFWYHHPAVAAEPAVEFLATSDGKLYCRVGNGKYESRGEVHARRHVGRLGRYLGLDCPLRAPCPPRADLYPVKVARGNRGRFDAAAEVELTAGNTTRRLWLQRGEGDACPSRQDEALAISYGYESLPLGFSLQLKKFTRGLNPGGMGDARFASTVRLHDETKHIDEDHEISMNEPLVHGKYTFYQSGILPSGSGTVLTVASDPGLFLKYLGSIMTCAGTLIMFVLRSIFGQDPAFPFFPDNDQDQGATHATCHRGQPGVDLPGRFGLCRIPEDQQFDWNAWRSLPVQDGGRQKPLDSLAWETWRLLGNRVSFTDPETHQSLDATAFYVATMLDSPTWDKKLPSPSGRGAVRHGRQGRSHPLARPGEGASRRGLAMTCRRHAAGRAGRPTNGTPCPCW